jgi:MSHA biogenesis protein MshP
MTQAMNQAMIQASQPMPPSNSTSTSTSTSIARRIRASTVRQRGFSLISAIFLLVVLAALGAAMLTISTVHQASSALDVQGARAYQAARAGINWGLYQQLQVPSPALACTLASAPKSFVSFSFPDAPTLRQFTVTVSCTLTQGPGALSRRQISAIACNQPDASGCYKNAPNDSLNDSPDYIERQMQVEF